MQFSSTYVLPPFCGFATSSFCRGKGGRRLKGQRKGGKKLGSVSTGRGDGLTALSFPLPNFFLYVSFPNKLQRGGEGE